MLIIPIPRKKTKIPPNSVRRKSVSEPNAYCGFVTMKNAIEADAAKIPAKRNAGQAG